MSVVVDMLAVGLSDGERADPGGRSSCLFVACFDPRTFRPEDGFLQTVENISARLKAVPPAEGFDQIILAGETEARPRPERTVSGIPLADAIWDALLRVAAGVGVAARV